MIAVPQNPEILILLLPQREQILRRKICIVLLREFTNQEILERKKFDLKFLGFPLPIDQEENLETISAFVFQSIRDIVRTACKQHV